MKYSILLGRIMFAAIFVAAAPGHFIPATIQAAASHGVPMASFLVPLSGIIAFAGGLSVMIGYKARLGAWLLVLFLVPVTIAMHNFWAVQDATMAQTQQAMFMKNIALMGGALMVAYFGAGPLSLDARVKSQLLPHQTIIEPTASAEHT